MQIPPLDEILAAAHVIAIPTRTRFRGISVREAVVFEAPEGATEFSPFLEYEPAEAAAWLRATVEFGWAPTPPALRTSIPVNATIPAVGPAAVAGVLSRFPGCSTVKVKVAEPGQTLADDIARVREVRRVMDELVGDTALIRVDANMAWTLDEAVDAIEALNEFGLDYVEQPCKTVAELAEVRRRVGRHKAPAAQVRVGDASPETAAHGGPATATPASTSGGSTGPKAPDTTPFDAPLRKEESTHMSNGVRIAADESVRKASDPVAVARAGAADLLVIKAQPLGGIKRAMQVIEEAGLPVVISSALDTSIGISMGLHLAAALPEGLLAGACGLGTVALLEGDVTADPLMPVNGAIELRRPALDPALLAKYRAAPEREEWWRERIAACYRLL